MAAVEQQQPRIVQMQPRPGRHVQHGAQTVVGLDRGDETLLKGEYGFKP
jgi:hypothetical protein